jgi:hypothetical protein
MRSGLKIYRKEIFNKLTMNNYYSEIEETIK